MDEETLRARLWQGFARLQALLGGHAKGGGVVRDAGLVASVVPHSPDSPALNAVVALDPDSTVARLDELERTYRGAGVRRWGLWLDGSARAAAAVLRERGMAVASSSPGMGAPIEALDLDGAPTPRRTDLRTVGWINDLAYGNGDGRLERTLAALPEDALRAYRADLDGAPASCALALLHNDDCGVSFVATVPHARRRGLATKVMRGVLADAAAHGCTTTSLQATAEGERLYAALGLRRLGTMELWERR